MSQGKDLLASIDIGSNSVLLLIAERRNGILEPYFQNIALPRIGKKLSETGNISEESFSSLQLALNQFLIQIKEHGALLVGAVATQAFRNAQNGPDLLVKVSEILGIEASIISGPEESRLGFLAVANKYPPENLVVIDIGGGSTEVTRKGQGMSLPIGAVQLMEACGQDANACREYAQVAFKEILSSWSGISNLVAVGGAASGMAMLELGLPNFDAVQIEGLELKGGQITAQINRLAGLDLTQKLELPGIERGRADIILPGLCILETFLNMVQCNSLKISDRGIRYGVILNWIKQQMKSIPDRVL